MATSSESKTVPETIVFDGQHLLLLDQTKLPGQLDTFRCETVAQTHDAIKRLVVRGAPAIGIAAAYGVCLATDENGSRSRTAYLAAVENLATSRPTAVNLFWALDRMKSIVDSVPKEPHGESDLQEALVSEARKIHDEDRQMCRDIGRHGAELLAGCQRVLTHCNAGGLATSMWGTALAPIYHLHESGHTIKVYADETRPLLQGARLTAWELSQAGVPVTVLTDSMAGSLMQAGQVDAVIVGADRIAANGDVANKIGTYPLAVLAHYHQIPFYVAAPSSTFDRSLAEGVEIPIEQRDRQEVSEPYGVLLVPDAAEVINPAFDCTPARLVTALITERGVIHQPDRARLANHFGW